MEPLEANPLNFGEVPPDTEWAPSDTSKEVDLTVKPFTTAEKAEAERYDHIENIYDKRHQAVYDVKTGAVNVSNFPTIFRALARAINVLPDGKFVTRPPDVDTPVTAAEAKKKGLVVIGNVGYARGVASKLSKFINIGVVGDALMSDEINKIANDIADETMLHISLDTDHPMRKLKVLMKKGKGEKLSQLDDIIDFNLKKKHYDVFDQKWVNGTLKPMIFSKIFELRKSEKALARGELGEGLEVILGNLKSIFYS